MLKKVFAKAKRVFNPINPIIIYQMGKVGSKTVEALLKCLF